MVSLWETIKGFALACKREALDCNPSGYHGFKIFNFNSEALDYNPSVYHDNQNASFVFTT